MNTKFYCKNCNNIVNTYNIYFCHKCIDRSRYLNDLYREENEFYIRCITNIKFLIYSDIKVNETINSLEKLCENLQIISKSMKKKDKLKAFL